MHTILMLFTVTPDWLRLDRQQRRDLEQQTLQPILKRYAPQVQTRFCDAEAFTARCSDFAIFEPHDLQQFYCLFEEVRDTPLFSTPYLILNDLIVGLNDGFRHFEARQALTGNVQP